MGLPVRLVLGLCHSGPAIRLVFDGFMSAIRTRTPEEVEHLLQTCGTDLDVQEWEVRSGKVLFLWPFGYLHWIVGLKKQKEDKSKR